MAPSSCIGFKKKKIADFFEKRGKNDSKKKAGLDTGTGKKNFFLKQ